jgi:hypothetical protein
MVCDFPVNMGSLLLCDFPVNMGSRVGTVGVASSVVEPLCSSLEQLCSFELLGSNPFLEFNPFMDVTFTTVFFVFTSHQTSGSYRTKYTFALFRRILALGISIAEGNY